jgi:ribosomal protein S18 acetylase RimI-like enzyme
MHYAPLAYTNKEMRAWVKAYLLQECEVCIATSRVSAQSQKSVAVLATSQGRGITWIEQLYIDPQYVDKGIGSALLRHIFNNKQKPFRLYVFQENKGARRLYERLGFRAIEFSDGERNEEKCPDVLYELR